MCLGTADISLYEMIGAFATFANKGSYIQPILITRIEDNNGVVLYQDATPSRAVMRRGIVLRDSQTAGRRYPKTERVPACVFRGTSPRIVGPIRTTRCTFTGYPWKFDNPIAGKTGTSQNQSDGWFIGMVPNLAAGAWVGCEDRAAHFRSMTYGQGASSAMPIWAVFMKKCYADPSLGVSKGEFEAPSTPMTIDLSCEHRVAPVAPISEEEDIEGGPFPSRRIPLRPIGTVSRKK